MIILFFQETSLFCSRKCTSGFVQDPFMTDTRTLHFMSNHMETHFISEVNLGVKVKYRRKFHFITGREDTGEVDV